MSKTRASAPCLSLWERWPSEARTERGSKGARPSPSPAVTALPKGEPRGCTPPPSNIRKMERICTDTLHELSYEHPEKARNRFCVFPPAFRGSMFVIVRYLPETGTLLFRITSCEPPSTMLVEETSVSFAFLRRSARFSTPQLHIVERTLPRVTARLSLRLPA
mgnify:CR=1 FL=1